MTYNPNLRHRGLMVRNFSFHCYRCGMVIASRQDRIVDAKRDARAWGWKDNAELGWHCSSCVATLKANPAAVPQINLKGEQ